MRFGTKCVGFEQDDAGVTVRFEDGSEERGRALIGADGILSTIRAQLGGSAARASGAQVTRALLPFEHPAIPAGTFILTFGGSSRFGLIHTSPDVLCWFGIFLAPPGYQGRPRGTQGRAAGALPRLPGADRRRDRRHAGGDDLPRRHLGHRPPVTLGRRTRDAARRCRPCSDAVPRSRRRRGRRGLARRRGLPRPGRLA